MRTNDFVCSCFGIDGDVIDELCDEFDLDLTDKDVIEAFRFFDQQDPWCVAKNLLMTILEGIIRDYPELDRDKFDYDFISPSFPSFYYDEEEFSTKADLDEIVERIEGAA